MRFYHIYESNNVSLYVRVSEKKYPFFKYLDISDFKTT